MAVPVEEDSLHDVFRCTIALGASSLALVLASSLGASAQGPCRSHRLDNLYESKVVAEIYSQVLEGQAGRSIASSARLARAERNPAFQGGQVDLVPEYRVRPGLLHAGRRRVRRSRRAW
ncbi:MAG: hypothetical protein U0869_07030 [Chloroflexota bacterium]